MGLFLLELKRHMEKLSKDIVHTSSSTKNRNFFFSPLTPHATSQSRLTQMGSRLGHSNGVTINHAIAICREHRPRPHGPQSHHPSHQQKKAIISRIASASITSETSQFCIDLYYISFEDKNYIICDLRSLNIPRRIFFSHSLSYLLSNIYFGSLFSKTRQHLRCNLVFGLTVHFGLLIDVNMSFFLSTKFLSLLFLEFFNLIKESKAYKK